jgi:hypothetical protein
MITSRLQLGRILVISRGPDGVMKAFVPFKFGEELEGLDINGQKVSCRSDEVESAIDMVDALELKKLWN